MSDMISSNLVSADPSQHVTKNDATELNTDAAYWVAPVIAQSSGNYPGVETVQAHQELVDVFTDSEIFTD